MFKKIALLVSCLFWGAYAWALQGYAGAWHLKKVVPVANTNIPPIMEVSDKLALEMISSQATIWVRKGLDQTADVDTVPYCHPEFLGGGDSTPSKDEYMVQFAKQAGGIEKVDKVLKKDLGVSFSRFNLTWGIGPGDSGKEPCKSIGNTTFYLTKDKKHVLVFKYPYIYRFDGGYGRIGSK
ncbi:hypothetical protein [Paludibacterium purpuratum]|uniref:Uncharacterized protein n=1 Tax=Paludibacterium purpuratum TaxID=1144873 RepID=A0A4R7BDQ8_9NEIS|nr:hypothetical protein [Paludibacterium purpuratum]TDR81896.1 hypothetical protein DFP86_1026 [Paludibacterium purpuratum]